MKKESKPSAFKIDPKLLTELRERKASTGISIAYMVNEAVRSYLAAQSKKEAA